MKKALLKLLRLTLVISLTLRFVLPYCHFALEVNEISICMFVIIGMIAIPLLLAIIMAFVKKKVYVEFLAIIISGVIFMGSMADVISGIDFELGNKLYKVEYEPGKLYNKWGVPRVKWDWHEHHYQCFALVEDERKGEIVLAFSKHIDDYSNVNSEFEVTSYNLSAHKRYIFVIDKYIREELDNRGCHLIDYATLGRTQVYNPFSDYYKNYSKTNNAPERHNAISYNTSDDDYYDYDDEDDYDAYESSYLSSDETEYVADIFEDDEYEYDVLKRGSSSDDSEWVPAILRESKETTSSSSTSSSDSEYDPWINYKNGVVAGMMNAGTDIYTGTDVNTSVSSTGVGNVSATQIEKYCHICGGTGICITCNGRGLMINSYTGQYEDCPNCGNPRGKCHSCGGTGRR